MNVSGGPTARRLGVHLQAAAALFVAVLVMAACGDSEPEPTVEELLQEAIGQTLTSTEVTRRLDVGKTLCQLDDQVLDSLWRQLSEDQLQFQDFVVSQLCPNRSIYYAGLTGRYVTEEAENSGIVPSTTQQPDSTNPSPSNGLPTTPTTSPSESPDSDAPPLELTPTPQDTTDDTPRGSIAPLDDSAPSGQIGPTTEPSSTDTGE